VGSVSAFAMPDVPEGWLICDGKAVSRTVYPRLFGAMGTIYGKGDGSTTFNLPDMRGLFVRGHDPEGKNDLKREFGSYQDDQIQSHSHTDSGHSHSCSVSQNGEHKHNGSLSENGEHQHSGKTSISGNHNHDSPFKFFEVKPPGNSSYKTIPSKELSFTKIPKLIYESGDHSHALDINSSGSHSHDLYVSPAGSHSHSVSINNGQANLSNPTNARHGSETRVKNIALIYCIKY